MTKFSATEGIARPSTVVNEVYLVSMPLGVLFIHRILSEETELLTPICNNPRPSTTLSL